MRNVAVLVMVIVLSLAAGCAGSPSESSGSKAKQPSYDGFMPLKAGMWAETVTKSGSAKVTTRVEVLEHSKDSVRYQFITDAGGSEAITQLWVSADDGSAERLVMKTGGSVFCPPLSDAPEGQVPDDGSAYPAGKRAGMGTYTTPTGRAVSVAKFAASSGEFWVSSEVPFGMVKVVRDGETVSSLYDFGTIGARSLIADEDVDACSSASAPTGYAAGLDYEEYMEDYDALPSER